LVENAAKGLAFIEASVARLSLGTLALESSRTEINSARRYQQRSKRIIPLKEQNV
jgi:hypothetical protein